MRRQLLLILWLATDYLLFLAAYTLAYFLRVGFIWSSDLPFRDFLTAVAVSGIPWLGALMMTRTFGLTTRQRTPRNALYIAYAAVVGLAFVALAYFFLFQGIFSRQLLLIAGLLSAAVTWLWHMVMGQCMRLMLRRDPAAYPTLIVGVTRESRKFLALLQQKKSPLKPVAILDATGVKDKEIEGVPVAGKLNALEQTLDKYGITHVIQCSDLEQSINLLSACRRHGITYIVLPSVFGIVEKDERVESLEGHAVTVVGSSGGWLGGFFR